MKSITLFVKTLLIMLVMTLCTCAFAADYPTGTAKGGTNIRVAPSASSRKINSLKSGDSCTITKYVKKGETADGVVADRDWYKIKSGSKLGYVIASNILVTSGDVEAIGVSGAAVDDSEVLDDGAEIVLDDGIADESGEAGVEILGDGATPVAADVDGLVEDDSAVVDESGGDLIEEDIVSDDGVVSDDIVPDDSSSGGITVNSNFKIANRLLYATQNVNVRAQPTTSASITSKLKVGDRMTGVEYIKSGSTYNGLVVSGNWYRSSKGNYVSAAYLSDKNPVAGSTSSSSSTGSGSSTSSKSTTVTNDASAKSEKTTSSTGSYKTTKSTTCYVKPMTLATKVKTLKANTTVTVSKIYKSGDKYQAVGVSGTWYQLSDGSFALASCFKKS